MTFRVRLIWFTLILAASLFNVVLAVSAALDLSWAADRVASGQYESLPGALRLGYLVFSVISVAQVVLAFRLLERGGAWSPASARASFALVLLYVVSTVISAISPSDDVRWTALPAFVLMVSFFMLRGPELKSNRGIA